MNKALTTQIMDVLWETMNREGGRCMDDEEDREEFAKTFEQNLLVKKLKPAKKRRK